MVREDALRLLDDLARCWEAAYGPLESTDADLRATRRYFDPVATGRRLRGAINEVKQVDPPPVPPPAPLALELPESRWLVTPDGRLAIDILSDALRDADDPVTIDAIAVIEAERRLLDLYRVWGRHRLDQVVKLQTGSERPLQIGPIALGLLLLVNRSTSETRALPCGPNDPLRRTVDAAVFPPVRAFEAAIQAPLSERQRLGLTGAQEKESLAGGWMPPELYRRFPFAVHEPLKNEPQLLWVRPAGAKRFLEALAAALERRGEVTKARVPEAFDCLVNTLRENGPTLAAHGLLHERPSDTKALRQRLLSLIGLTATTV